MDGQRERERPSLVFQGSHDTPVMVSVSHVVLQEGVGPPTGEHMPTRGNFNGKADEKVASSL